MSLGTSGCSGTTVALGNLRVAMDANRNGAVEPQEAVATDTPGAVSLQPGQSASLMVRGGVPAVASGVACVELSAKTVDNEQSATVSTAVQVGSGAAVSLSKSVVSDPTLVRGSSTLTFTVTATNIGTDAAAPTSTAGATATAVTVDGAPASYVLVRDQLPAGTQYVLGSLRSANIQGKRLFRTAGDAPFTYRSTEDAAAIEVAVGLPGGIAPQAAESMSFQAKLTAVTPGQSPDIVNVGDADYQSGLGQISVRSNAVVLPVSDHRLGVALRAVSTVPQTDAAGVTDGTAVVTFRARMRNYGGAPLYNPQLRHRIEGGDINSSFGAWTAAAVPTTGQYTIVPGSLRIVASAPSNTVAPLSTSFNGRTADDNLLAPGGVLPVGGDITVEYGIRVNFLGRASEVRTTASALAPLGASAFHANRKRISSCFRCYGFGEPPSVKRRMPRFGTM